MTDSLQALLASGKRPVLYQFWRSSASWRVRWALLIKGVPFERVHVDLLNGEQDRDGYRARSPIGTVPALQVGERLLSESVAILEWLEESVPEPRLYPRDPWARARVRQVVELINSEIHPMQTGAVRGQVSPDEAVQKKWTQHFNARGLEALDKLVAQTDAELGRGKFLIGDQLTAADLCLAPQLAFSRRFEVPVDRFPRWLAAEAAALATEHAAAARPELQPGAPG